MFERGLCHIRLLVLQCMVSVYLLHVCVSFWAQRQSKERIRQSFPVSKMTDSVGNLHGHDFLVLSRCFGEFLLSIREDRVSAFCRYFSPVCFIRRDLQLSLEQAADKGVKRTGREAVLPNPRSLS